MVSPVDINHRRGVFVVKVEKSSSLPEARSLIAVEAVLGRFPTSTHSHRHVTNTPPPFHLTAARAIRFSDGRSWVRILVPSIEVPMTSKLDNFSVTRLLG